MITKFIKFNESVKSLLIGPTEDEVWNVIRNLSPNNLLIQSSKNGILKGVKIAIEEGAEINYQDYKAFILARENDHEEILEYLNSLVDLPKSPEEFILDIIDNIKIKDGDEDKLFVCFEKYNKIIFEKDLNGMILYVDSSIWYILRNFYNLTVYDIQFLIKNNSNNYLKWEKFKPVVAFGLPILKIK